jgi:hypothetical protein
LARLRRAEFDHRLRRRRLLPWLGRRAPEAFQCVEVERRQRRVLGGTLLDLLLAEGKDLFDEP